MKIKKILSLVLAVAMIMAVVPSFGIVASAADDVKYYAQLYGCSGGGGNGYIQIGGTGGGGANGNSAQAPMVVGTTTSVNSGPLGSARAGAFSFTLPANVAANAGTVTLNMNVQGWNNAQNGGWSKLVAYETNNGTWTSSFSNTSGLPEAVGNNYSVGAGYWTDKINDNYIGNVTIDVTTPVKNAAAANAALATPAENVIVSLRIQMATRGMQITCSANDETQRPYLTVKKSANVTVNYVDGEEVVNSYTVVKNVGDEFTPAVNGYYVDETAGYLYSVGTPDTITVEENGSVATIPVTKYKELVAKEDGTYNRTINGSFEEGYTGWTTMLGNELSNDNFSIVTDHVSDGVQAIKPTKHSSSSTDASIDTRWDVKPNGQYYMAFDAMGTTGTHQFSWISIGYDSVQTRSLWDYADGEDGHFYLENGSWKTIERIITTTEQETKLGFRAAWLGDAYPVYDNFRLYELEDLKETNAATVQAAIDGVDAPKSSVKSGVSFPLAETVTDGITELEVTWTSSDTETINPEGANTVAGMVTEITEVTLTPSVTWEGTVYTGSTYNVTVFHASRRGQQGYVADSGVYDLGTENLVTAAGINASFEGDTWIDGWKSHTNQNTNVPVKVTESSLGVVIPDGESCFGSHWSDNISGTNYCTIYTLFPVQAGANYLSFYARRLKATSAQVYAFFTTDGSNTINSVPAGATKVNVTNSWEKFEYVFESETDGYVAFLAYSLSEGANGVDGGTLFDDFEVYTATPVAAECSATVKYVDYSTNALISEKTVPDMQENANFVPDDKYMVELDGAQYAVVSVEGVTITSDNDSNVATVKVVKAVNGNMVANGDFSNGLEGWDSLSTDWFEVNDGVLLAKSNAWSNHEAAAIGGIRAFQKNIDVTPKKVYYYSIDVMNGGNSGTWANLAFINNTTPMTYGNTSNLYLTDGAKTNCTTEACATGDIVVPANTAGQWHTISGFVTADYVAKQFEFDVYYLHDSYQVKIDNVVLVETELVADPEPTLTTIKFVDSAKGEELAESITVPGHVGDTIVIADVAPESITANGNIYSLDSTNTDTVVTQDGQEVSVTYTTDAITSADSPAAITVIEGNAPILPQTVIARTGHGAASEASVTWDLGNLSVGANTVEGTVDGTSVKATVTVNVLAETFAIADMNQSSGTQNFGVDITEKFTIEFDYEMSDPHNNWIYISNNGALWGAGQVGIGMTNDTQNKIKFQPEGDADMITLELNTTYRIIAEIDPTTSTYNAVMTDPNGNVVKNVEGYGFRTASTTINSIVATTNGAPGQFTLTNIKINAPSVADQFSKYTVKYTGVSKADETFYYTPGTELGYNNEKIFPQVKIPYFEGYVFKNKTVSGTTVTLNYEATQAGNFFDNVANDTTLVSLNMLGAHDAFTANIGNGNKFDAAAAQQGDSGSKAAPSGANTAIASAKAQSADALTMLNAGVRYFDIRLSRSTNTAKGGIIGTTTIAHTNGVFYTTHGMLSDEFRTIAYTIGQWAKEHPGELIVLDFQEAYDYTDGHDGNGDAATWQAINAILEESGINDFVTVGNASVKNHTYGALTNNGSKAGIVLWGRAAATNSNVGKFILRGTTSSAFAGRLYSNYDKHGVSIGNSFSESYVQAQVDYMAKYAEEDANGDHPVVWMQRVMQAQSEPSNLLNQAGKDNTSLYTALTKHPEWLTALPIVMVNDATTNTSNILSLLKESNAAKNVNVSYVADGTTVATAEKQAMVGTLYTGDVAGEIVNAESGIYYVTTAPVTAPSNAENLYFVGGTINIPVTKVGNVFTWQAGKVNTGNLDDDAVYPAASNFAAFNWGSGVDRVGVAVLDLTDANADKYILEATRARNTSNYTVDLYVVSKEAFDAVDLSDASALTTLFTDEAKAATVTPSTYDNDIILDSAAVKAAVGESGKVVVLGTATGGLYGLAGEGMKITTVNGRNVTVNYVYNGTTVKTTEVEGVYTGNIVATHYTIVKDGSDVYFVTADTAVVEGDVTEVDLTKATVFTTREGVIYSEAFEAFNWGPNPYDRTAFANLTTVADADKYELNANVTRFHSKYPEGYDSMTTKLYAVSADEFATWDITDSAAVYAALSDDMVVATIAKEKADDDNKNFATVVELDAETLKKALGADGSFVLVGNSQGGLYGLSDMNIVATKQQTITVNYVCGEETVASEEVETYVGIDNTYTVAKGVYYKNYYLADDATVAIVDGVATIELTAFGKVFAVNDNGYVDGDFDLTNWDTDYAQAAFATVDVTTTGALSYTLKGTIIHNMSHTGPTVTVKMPIYAISPTEFAAMDKSSIASIQSALEGKTAAYYLEDSNNGTSNRFGNEELNAEVIEAAVEDGQVVLVGLCAHMCYVLSAEDIALEANMPEPTTENVKFSVALIEGADSGKVVIVVDGEELVVTKDEDGNLTVELEPGEHTITVRRPGYLARTFVDLDAAGIAALGDIELIAGDVNDDGTVDIEDLQAVKNIFSLNSEDAEFDLAHDFNDDGTVDIEDLQAVINSFALSSDVYE